MRAVSRRRRVLIAVVALVVVVVGGGVVWRLATFPARHETMPGLPIDLLVQDGVSDAEVAEVRAGLRAADAYLRTVQGAGVSERVEVRVARSRGCVRA